MESIQEEIDIIKCNAPIGVFDSGVGGLTVAREIMRNMPHERIVYFGDTARVPYGSKSKATIVKYTNQVIRFLRTLEVKAIVVACNTASALALEDIRMDLDIPIIGVIKSGAKIASMTTRNGKIGVIATEATINSQIYSTFIHDMNKNTQVIGKACPLFVPLVEEGLIKDPVTDEIASRYLAELKQSDIDTLILGCTHYPLLRDTIRRTMGEGITLVNPAYETAKALEQLLREKNLINPSLLEETEKPYKFFVSDAADKFKQFANSILPYDIDKTQQINIEEY